MKKDVPKEDLYSVEFYEETLGRLRIKLRDAQDQMDITSFAIKSLEDGLKLAQEKEDANETNAKEE